jgi:hypothetical protein
MRIFSNAKARKAPTYAELRGLVRFFTPTTESWFAIAFLGKAIGALANVALQIDEALTILRAFEVFHRVSFFEGVETPSRPGFRQLFASFEVRLAGSSMPTTWWIG